MDQPLASNNENPSVPSLLDTGICSINITAKQHIFLKADSNHKNDVTVLPAVS
jgi:hypothetical protein